MVACFHGISLENHQASQGIVDVLFLVVGCVEQEGKELFLKLRLKI